MKKTLDFLAKSPAFYVATTDHSNRPRVRPFSFAMEWEGKLTFATNNTKKIYKELQANPFVEICSFDDSTGEWIRISGKVRLFRSEEANKEVFRIAPALKDIYRSADNPILACFSIEEGEVTAYNFASMNEPAKSLKL